MIRKFYKGQRAVLLRLARSLALRPTTEDRSLVEALRFVLENDRLGRRGEFVPGRAEPILRLREVARAGRRESPRRP